MPTYEVKFGGITENDDGTGTRFSTDAWEGKEPSQAIIDAALQVAITLTAKPVGMRFVARNEKGAIIRHSGYIAFDVMVKAADELEASADPKEKAQAEAARRDGTKRAVIGSLTMPFREGDKAVALPKPVVIEAR